MLSKKGAACAICAHTHGMSNKHVKKIFKTMSFYENTKQIHSNTL